MRNSSLARVPPPLFFGLAFAAGWAVHLQFPRSLPSFPLVKLAAVVLSLLAALLAAASLLHFLHARTSLRPGGSPRALVTSGPFRFSRNPMYLSLALLYAALCLFLRLLWPLLLLPVAIGLTHVLAVRDEERRLRAAFGAAFDAYARRVRCWL